MVSPFARFAQFSGALLGLLGVVLGAFGAHAFHDRLIQNETLDAWRTASSYQFIHALALLAISQGPERRGPIICWLVGVILFSGSLYFLALDPVQKWLGPITPIGGLILIIGWGWLGVSSWKNAT